MKYLGIDYGSRRLGLAVSNSEGTIAFPRTTLENGSNTIPSLMKLIEEEKIEMIVIGDTHALNGAKNTVTNQADAFIEKLSQSTNIEVLRAFEGWSSIEASRYAPEGAPKDDASAAAIILQRFLDMKSR